LVTSAVLGERGTQTSARLVSAGELSYVDGSVEPPEDVWKSKRQAARDAGNLVEVEIVGALELWARVTADIGTPSFLSVDVEGGELDILSALPLSTEQPILICAETSLDAARSSTMDGLLVDAGYVRVLRSASQWDNWYVLAGVWDRVSGGREGEMSR